MATPIPPLPPDELLRQAADLEAGATPPQQSAPPAAPQSAPSTSNSARPKTRDNRWVVIGLFSLLLTFVIWFFSSKKLATSPAPTEPAATKSAKTSLAKPQAEPATKTGASEAATTTSFPSFVSEFQKLRNEIEGLKNRLSATPATPTIKFPSEISVRLIPSQEGNKQAVEQQQPADQLERRQLSDEERARRGWEQYQRSYNQP